jgi:hypothetical protein
MAVGRGTGDLGRADGAGRTGAVLNHDRPSERFTHRARQQPGVVSAPPPGA